MRVDVPTIPTSGSINTRSHGASGSEFETPALVTVGANRVTVADIGDFKAGQGVTVSPANVRFVDVRIYDPTELDRARAVTGEVELRGFDAKETEWRTFLLDIDSEDSLTFRWSNDIANTWAEKVPITMDWQALSDGVEIRFKSGVWETGHLITFHARAELNTEILAVDGNVLTLKDAANVTTEDAVVRHHDQEAIERALQEAIRQKRNLFIPSGRYRLSRGFTIPQDASIAIDGESDEHTILDISGGIGAVFRLDKSKSVILRNMSLVGHTGFKEVPLQVQRSNGEILWSKDLRSCQALNVAGAERVWVENVHASRMSSECFYSRGPCREGLQPDPEHYTRELTFLRCTVTDVLFNAFNNNDFADNTNILYCRVNGASNFWEGPNRFVRCIGNHVRNCHHYGTFGNTSHRFGHFNYLGTGQMVIADNVFEGHGHERSFYQRDVMGVVVVCPSNETIIRNNIFINFSTGTALYIGYHTGQGFPAQHITVTGNMIDLTHELDIPASSRTGILVECSDVVVSDNQIYVRGEIDPETTGIVVEGATTNVTVHDNIIRNCARGVVTTRTETSVKEVLGKDRFLAGCEIAKEWEYSHRYCGWFLHWIEGANAGTVSAFDSFDAKTMEFKLQESLKMTVGDRFAYYPRQANWMFHHNTISGCAEPVVLDSHGSDTSMFTDNLVSCEPAIGVKEALTLKGNFAVIGNRIVGFDEKDSVGIAVHPDPLGKLWDKNCVNNTVIGCSRDVLVVSK